MPSISPGAAGRFSLFALAAIGLATFLFTVHLELSLFGDKRVHIDEYYFSACAVRGLHAGLVPIAGCQDNKAPLIYFLYEIIYRWFGDYNFAALKAVAIPAVLATTLCLAWSAYRVSGLVAAIVTASLMLSSLASHLQYMALKTELVGSLFLSGALLILLHPGALKSGLRLASAGLLVGAAVVSKQTYAFAGFAIIIWLFLSEPRRSLGQIADFFGRSFVFGLFVLFPFLAFWLLFSRQHTANDYLASFFLYPKIYGPSCGSGLAVALRCIGRAVGGVSEQYLLAVMSSGAIAALIFSAPKAATQSRFADPRWLIAIVAILLTLQFALTQWWFSSYSLMIIGPMALLVGVMVGDHWPQAWRVMPRATLVVATMAIAGLVLVGFKTWSGNAEMEEIPKPEAFSQEELAEIHANPTAPFAYELGDFPDFYAQGRFVPASSIQFPWGLPGTPEIWSYLRPPPGTMARRLLDRQQAQDLAIFYREFARTPPRFILFRDNQVRSGKSGAIEVPGFQVYLDRNCKLRPKRGPADPYSLYECGIATAQGPH